MSKNPLESYGAWVAETPDAWPEDALDWAHREFVDFIAVMVPGAAEPASQFVYNAVQDWGQGPCAVAGQRKRLSAPWAAPRRTGLRPCDRTAA